MSHHLSELIIKNFRSIKGTVAIPLDAPIVLIHGANGAGKTSIATALELALTGDVAALRRGDEKIHDHLVNRDAAMAEIDLRVLGGPRLEARMTVQGGAIEGRALLDADGRTFYSDRCYLSQSTLSRLLDIYQAPTSRDPTNTPLTNFVKSLLGLDQLEALIDGLYPAGHKARMSKLSSDFDRADQLEKRLQSEQEEIRVLVKREQVEIAELEGRLRPLRLSLNLPESLEAAKTAIGQANDPHLLSRHEARVDRLVSLQLNWSTFPPEHSSADLPALEAEEAVAAAAVAAFQSGPGKRLTDAITNLKQIFPDIADPEQTNPEEARRAALALVTREIARLESLQSSAATAKQALAITDQSISQSRARLLVLDEQINMVAGDTAGLGQVLATLLPHIHDDTCPVCHRDFADQPGGNLRTHVSEEIARLVGRSEQLRELTNERQQVQAQLAHSERNRSAEEARQLPQPDATMHQQRLAILRIARSELDDTANTGGEGVKIRDRLAQAASRVARLRLRDSTAAEIRATLDSLAQTIGEPGVGAAEPTQVVLSRLLDAAKNAQAAAKKQAKDLSDAKEIISRLEELNEARTARLQETSERTEKLARMAASQRVVSRERDIANSLRIAATEARTAIVGRVFNERLNAIWRDLFVRLAPNEPFVPAFVLPNKGGEPVAALLETVHREGGSYGRPGAMLSAGNLNTAALTLFLSLHLSVKPNLPWLFLDDPVQSMDELHIAQFAALLRTLAKREGRQVMIAIHERQLFDYLTLELSPAFVGDKLITVELGKSAELTTQYDTKVFCYEPDRLVA